MIRNKDFEVVTVADEYMAVPLGDEATSFHGVVTLSESTAFLLNFLEESHSVEEIVDAFLAEYEVDRETAEKDIKGIIPKLVELKLIKDS